MKKKLIAFLSTLLLGGVVYAQTTAVTATVVDSDSTVWAGATWTLAFVPGPSQSNPANYTIGGAPLDPAVTSQTGIANGSGVITFTTYRSTSIIPSASAWKLVVCPNASTLCGTYSFNTSASSVDISTGVNASIQAPRFKAIAGTYGYNDGEAILSLLPGSQYFNVTSGKLRLYSGSSWADSGGGGSPTGAAGGGLTGAYPNPGLSSSAVVAGVNGQPIAPSSVTIPGAPSGSYTKADGTGYGTPIGGGTPASPTGSAQFNNGGSFGGNPNVLDVSAFPGADAGIKINACFTALGASIGARCDVSSLSGTAQSSSVDINVPAGEFLTGAIQLAMANGKQITVGEEGKIVGPIPSTTYSYNGQFFVTGNITTGALVSLAAGATFQNAFAYNLDTASSTSAAVECQVSATSCNIIGSSVRDGYYGVILRGANYYSNIFFLYTFSDSNAVQIGLYVLGSNGTTLSSIHATGAKIGVQFDHTTAAPISGMTLEGNSVAGLVVDHSDNPYGNYSSVQIVGLYCQNLSSAWCVTGNSQSNSKVTGLYALTDKGIDPAFTGFLNDQPGSSPYLSGGDLGGSSFFEHGGNYQYIANDGNGNGPSLGFADSAYSIQNNWLMWFDLNSTGTPDFSMFLQQAGGGFTAQPMSARQDGRTALGLLGGSYTSRATAGADLFGGTIITGRTSTANLAAPSCSVTQVGTAGSTSYTYYVVAQDAGSGATLPVSCSTSTGNATLNSTNYNVISVGHYQGYYTAPIYRTNTTNLIGTIPALIPGGTFSLKDTGQTPTSTPAPTRDSTADLHVAGQSFIILPTSCSGLPTGTLWNNSGTVAPCP